jgi:hypothetical protein
MVDALPLKNMAPSFLTCRIGFMVIVVVFQRKLLIG